MAFVLLSTTKENLILNPLPTSPIFMTAAGCNYKFYVFMLMKVSIFMSKSVMSAQSQQQFFHRVMYKY